MGSASLGGGHPPGGLDGAPQPNPYEDPRCQETDAPSERIVPIFSAVLQAERRSPLATCSVFMAVCWCINVTAPHPS